MATVIRPEISQRNKYWIDKHRHYELKHFCLQYPLWKKKYKSISKMSVFTSKLDSSPSNNELSDSTANHAINKARYSSKIDLIEKAALEADPVLYEYILKGVTEGLSYIHLRAKLNIPCGKDMYYDRYRRFFWLLHNLKD